MGPEVSFSDTEGRSKRKNRKRYKDVMLVEEIGSRRTEYTRRSHSSNNIDTTKSKCIRNEWDY